MYLRNLKFEVNCKTCKQEGSNVSKSTCGSLEDYLPPVWRSVYEKYVQVHGIGQPMYHSLLKQESRMHCAQHLISYRINDGRIGVLTDVSDCSGIHPWVARHRNTRK